MLSLLASTVLTAAITASCNSPCGSCPLGECQAVSAAPSCHGGHAAIAPGASAAGDAQVNQGYRSNSYEPAAAKTTVPQGGQAYRSYSYAPAATPIYRSTSGRGTKSGYSGKPIYLIPKTLR